MPTTSMTTTYTTAENLQARIQDFYSVAHGAVSYVAKANYQEREREAKGNLRKTFDYLVDWVDENIAPLLVSDANKDTVPDEETKTDIAPSIEEPEERGAFEAAVLKRDSRLKEIALIRDGVKYVNPFTNAQWQGWQMRIGYIRSITDAFIDRAAEIQGTNKTEPKESHSLLTEKRLPSPQYPIFRHIKTSAEYRVLEIARSEAEPDKAFVIYQNVTNGATWARAIEEFYDSNRFVFSRMEYREE